MSGGIGEKGRQESTACFGQKKRSLRFRLARKLSRAKLLQEFVAQAIKTAIGHDEEQITGLDFVPKMLSDGVGTGKHAGIFAEGTNTLRYGFGVQAILSAQLLGAENTAENHAVAKCERLRQRILKHFAAHGI